MLTVLSATALAVMPSSPVRVPGAVNMLPLLPLSLRQCPLVGETMNMPLPADALLEEVLQRSEGRFGLLFRTSNNQVITWTPLLQIEGSPSDSSHYLRVRCIGRRGISNFLSEPVAGSTSLRLHSALAQPYEDVPLEDKVSKELDLAMEDMEELYSAFRTRSSRAQALRGITAEDVASTADGDTLMARGEERASALLRELSLGLDPSDDSAVRLLTTCSTFAAFDREVVTWKTRLAAMQCTDTVARVALAQRAMKWTVRRLDAEISLRLL